MKLFIRPKFKLNSDIDNKKHAEFEISPLEKGYGHTIGNVLRRTMISSIPGSGIYAVKIENANHEFVSIDGVVENVSAIILNLKQIILKVSDDQFEELERVTIEIKNNKNKTIIKAGDIILPAGVEILNPELIIAHKNEGFDLNMELYFCKWRGYNSKKDNKKLMKLISNKHNTSHDTNTIVIDTNFSPILNANYKVVPTKVGKADDLEKLTLIVDTDGAIIPSDAVGIASKIIKDHLLLFESLEENIKQDSFISEEIEEVNDDLNKSIYDLDFTQRSENCLKKSKILTLRDLISKTENEIQNIRNLGKKSFKEIKEKLAELKLNFAAEE